MFSIDSKKNISVTRGDTIKFSLSCKNGQFSSGSVINFNVVDKISYNKKIFTKAFPVNEATDKVIIEISSQESKNICAKNPNNTSFFYHYEIELVFGDGKVVTLIGYDDEGSKRLTFYPEAEGVIYNE